MEKKKILIVDDNEEIRQLYAEIFRRNAFEVLEAKDGVEGADKATSEDNLAAILTGIVMPRMDGFQMLEILRKNAVLKEIPAFINSHLGREEDEKKAKEMGLDGFFVRGTITPSAVCQKIQEKIDERERDKQGRRYLLAVNPWELDGEIFIENCQLPLDLKCDNCGTPLALEVSATKKEISLAQLVCPNCKKKFLN